MKTWKLSLLLAFVSGWVRVSAAAQDVNLASARPHAWQRWEHALSSTRGDTNPYANITLRVTYTGPGQRRLRAYGFWDGGDIFRIRCAFPMPGAWQWQTECSDTSNTGLHGQRGSLVVLPYSGGNALYRHGFLKVSDNRRYLAFGDETPFLWMGDTAWAVPQKASPEEWEQYIGDRVAKHFTLLQVAPAPKWAGEHDRQGQPAFTDKTCGQWNPAYWQAFERKVQRANERGLDQPYLDFVGVQTGHNAGHLDWCAHHAIAWNLHLYGHKPHKPVINLEAMYDAQGANGWRALDARALGWRTWLSGAMGYTYGAGDLPPKVPQGNGAVFLWVTDPEKYDYWKKALQWESAFQMQSLHDFLAAIEWWRLEPAHELIRNQPAEVTRRRVLARSAAGDLAVAYLPDNSAIEIDLSSFASPLAARWFDPVKGRYTSIAGTIENKGTRSFAPPGKGDWVLLLQRAGSKVSAAAAGEALVRNAEEFRQAVAQAKPGTRILLAPGAYPGGFYFSNLQGATNGPIIIAAADPAHPPVIQGAATGLHFSRPAFVELHD
jgi:hypothetical protein